MDSIWAFLNELDDQDTVSEKEMRLLKLLSNIGDADERNRVAQICANGFHSAYNTKTAQRILLHLLYDSDPTVRVNACDSLGSSNAVCVLLRLFPLLKNKDFLLRGYAALSIADISAKKALDIRNYCKRKLDRRNRFEQEPWVQTCYDGALYRLGDIAAKDRLVAKLSFENEHVRYLALQHIETYVPWQTDAGLAPALSTTREQEPIGYIREKYDQMLRALRTQHKGNAAE